MKRKKAYLNLSKANASKVKERGYLVVQKMTGNAAFPAPSPTLAAIKAQADLIGVKQADQDAAFQSYQQKTLEVNQEKDVLLNMLEQQAGYVELTANNDESKIVSAGFDLKQAATPIGELPTPQNALAKEGPGAGEILFSWKSVKGAKAYNVEQNFDITKDEEWAHVMTVTRAKCVIGGLTSGVKVWFRVSAIGAAGQGPYSDVSAHVVP